MATLVHPTDQAAHAPRPDAAATMRAVVFVAPGRLEVRNAPRPTAGPSVGDRVLSAPSRHAVNLFASRRDGALKVAIIP